MKVIFGGETKRIPEIKEFDELVRYAANVFEASELNDSKNDLRLFYQDNDGGLISGTC